MTPCKYICIESGGNGGGQNKGEGSQKCHKAGKSSISLNTDIFRGGGGIDALADPHQDTALAQCCLKSWLRNTMQYAEL
jgi:hypothetical protein